MGAVYAGRPARTTGLPRPGTCRYHRLMISPRPRGTSAALGLLVALLLLPRPVIAAPPPGPTVAQKGPHKKVAAPRGKASRRQRAWARSLLQKGLRLHGAGDFAGALRKFRQAYALVPSPKVKFNIANTLVSMGRLVEAAEALEELVVDPPVPVGPEVLELARPLLRQVEQRLASISLRSKVTGAVVRIDNYPRGKTPLARRIFLKPGTYALRVDHDDHPTFDVKMTLGPGEHAIVKPPWGKRAPTAVAQPEPDPRPRPKPATDQRPAGRPEPSRGRTIAAYSTLAGGLALTVAAGVLYGLGGAQGAAAHDDYRAATVEAEILTQRNEVEAARTKLIVGHALIGAAAVTLGASIYLFLTRPTEEQREASRRLNVALSPGPDGAGLVISGGF